MPPAERLLGEPVAADIHAEVTERVRDCCDRGTVPTLGTVLMSDDRAHERFMELKHAACDEVGIRSRDVRLDPTATESRLHRAIDRLCTDSEVHAVFVQIPLPDHVELSEVRYRLDPRKDVDCFHPENLGRLVRGNPQFVPATPAAVCRLLAAYDISLCGQHVVIVGRGVIGSPLANHLLQDVPHGTPTVTVCHSRTPDIASVTRRADIVVTTCGVPELVDGSMLSPGVVIVDVSANRQVIGGETQLIGDVEYESAREAATAITPVPGGVGPVTLAMLVQNVVRAAEQQD